MRHPELFGGVFAGRRVLVTGHTGFKGSWLALWLQALGAQVYGLALPAEGDPNHSLLLDLTHEQALIDLRDAAAVCSTLQCFAPEVVFHLAAQPLVRRSYRLPAATFDTNVMGLVNLLEAVRRTPSVRAVVNATTDKCYDNLDDTLACREGDPLGGSDPYSASKACAEIISASYRRSFLSKDDGRGFTVGLATARAGNVVGGGDWAEDRLIPDLVRCAVSSRVTRIRYPQATRPWQHVLEPLAGYLALAQRLLARPAEAAQAWNFGPDAAGELSVQQVVQRMQACWPAIDVELDRQPHPHEAVRLRLDCAKARERLAWRPVWSADTTLTRTANWYRRHHESGEVRSSHDLHQYVHDARHAGLAWAA